MTKDERDCAQAAIEQLTTAINGFSRALMLDNNEYPNAVEAYIIKATDCIKDAKKWADKIKRTQ